MRSIDPKLLSRLISLVRKRCEGIDLLDISREYFKCFGIYLNANDFDFKSMYSLCQKVCKDCDYSLVVRERNVETLLKSDRIFFDEIRFKKWILKEQKVQNVVFLESLVCHSLPNDVVFHTKHNRLPSLRLPHKAFDQNYIQVMAAKLSYVESPQEIYIHLSQYKDMYKKLREELRFYDPFYGDPNEKYIFPYELVIKGYYCVVRNPQDNYNWHRAIIIDDREGFDDETNEAIHSVTVFAIDWGNTIIERRDELRLIKKQFFKYPPFAVRVSLAGIAPICQDWTPEATVFMKAFISRFCAEYTMACAFLYPLDSDYYSVLLGHLVEVTKEGIREKMMIYLHEKMIRRNLARIKVTEDDDFNFSPVSRITYLPMPSVSHIEDEDYVSTRNEITLYEALNENLLQIKLEPFDEQVIKQESVDCEEKQIDSNCDKKDSINGKESVEEAVIDYKSKYFTSSNGIRKREYYHKEMTVEPKPKYFPLEKWTECKPKYYPLQESVERKPKYGDLLWKIEGRKYYQKQDLNLVINKPKYFTQELLNEFRKKYSSVH